MPYLLLIGQLLLVNVGYTAEARENALAAVHLLPEINAIWSKKEMTKVERITKKELPQVWYLAAAEGNIELLKFLKDHNIPGRRYTSEDDRVGKNLWYVAAQEGRVKTLQWLKDNRIGGMNMRPMNGYSLWQTAAVRGFSGASNLVDAKPSHEVFAWLLKNNIPGKEEFREFASKKFDLILTHNQMSSLDWLMKHGFFDKKLIAEYHPEIYIESAMLDPEYGPELIVEWLLKNNIPGVDYTDGNKNIWTVGYPEIIELLLKYHVSGRDFISKDGENVWLSGAKNGSRRVLELLDENNVSGRDHVDNEGKNIWLYAASAYFATDVLDWLTEHNVAGRERADNQGKNIWLHAASNETTLQYLLKHKMRGLGQADIEGKNVWLHAAENSESLKLLAAYDVAGRDHVDIDGKNIWMYASSSINADQIFQWLKDHEVPGLDGRDKFGYDMWHYVTSYDAGKWLEKNYKPKPKEP